MPSIRELQEATTSIPITRGGVSFTLTALLERVASGDETYQKLKASEAKIQSDVQSLIKEIDDAVAGIAQLKSPSEPRFLTFRHLVDTHLSRIAELLETDSLAAAEEVQSTRSVTERVKVSAWEAAEAEVQSARAALAQFESEILPTPEEIAEREAAAQKSLSGIEAKIKAANTKIERLRAERLVHLLDPEKGWDITEGVGAEGEDENVKMWPLTVENVLSLSPQLRAEMLQEVERAVFSGPF